MRHYLALCSFIIVFMLTVTMVSPPCFCQEKTPEEREAEYREWLSSLDFLFVCRDHIGPKKAPHGGYLRVTHEFLVEQLPSRTGLERKACLLALERMAMVDETDNTLRALEKVWNETPDREGRWDIFTPLVLSMYGSKNYELSEKIVRFVTASPLNECPLRAISALTLIPAESWPLEERNALTTYVAAQVKEGEMPVPLFQFALRLAITLGVQDDPYIDDIIMASGEFQGQRYYNYTVEDRIAALGRLVKGPPSEGAVMACMLASAHSWSSIAEAGQATYNRLAVKKAGVERDRIFLKLLREVPDDFMARFHSDTASHAHTLGAGYFVAEAKRDTDGLVERLKWADINFSEKELSYFSHLKLDDEIIQKLRKLGAAEK